MSSQIQITGETKVKSLTGVLVGTSGVVSSLNIDGSLGIPQLDVNGKILVSQLPNSVMEYKGTWDASTNTPTLVNGTGNQGDVYLCNVAGTVNFGAGAISFVVSDQVIYSGSIWQKASGSNGTVTSVAITETGDSLNITGSPITTSGTINIGFNGTNLQYVNGAGNLTTFPALTGYVPYTGATQDVDLDAFKLNAQSLHVKGTAGNGHLGLKHQSANATASANEVSLFADSLGNLSWLNGNLYLSKFITSSNTANRTYTFPNATGTVALTSDISYPVTSVFSRTGAVVATSGDYTTDQVTEGTTNLYFTNARARTAISLTTFGSTGASTYDNSTGVLNIPNYVDQYVGTVTSVGLSAPTGFSVSGSPVTSSGTLALSFASGYSLPTNVKQSNWDDAYTWVAAFPTQTGNTGKFLTTDGSTLSWVVNPLGTVTSVAMTVPTGLSIAGSPITSSGTLAVTFAAGYSIPTNASQTTWDTAYTNRITSLTVTGSSGASTLISNVLNIPTYTLSGLGGQPLATNLTSLSGLTFASTSFVKMTAAGTFALDTNTYALASALGNYLPLAGGTLTGPLGGTSATFSSTIISNNAIGVEKNGSNTFGSGGRFYLYNAATTDGMLIQLNASNNIDFWGVTTSTPTASPIITFTRAGAATFSSSITATAAYINNATFSEGATYFDIDTLAGKKLRLNNSGNQLIMGTNGIVSIGSIGDNGTGAILQVTGAATFSSTITAINKWEITSSAEERLNGQDNSAAKAARYYQYSVNEMRFYAINTSGVATAVKLMEYNGVTYDRVLTSGNYNSYAPTLTGTGASGTWGISITGSAASADSVNWNAVAGGTSLARTNLSLMFKAPTAGYSGLQFLKRSDDTTAGYLLVADANSDEYNVDGISLVADKSWLTLAQRNTAGVGIKIVTGTSTLVKRFEWLTNGTINSYSPINSYGGFIAYNSGNKKIYDLTTTEFFQYAEDNVTALASNYYNLAANQIRFYAKNGSGVTTGIKIAQYNGSSYENVVTEARTLTINSVTYDLSANRSWTVGGGGSASWPTLSGGTRVGYDIRSKPATSSGSYGGFQFMNFDDSNAGYLLVANDNNDTYTNLGITLVADTGWLTLAQRNTASKGIQFNTGTTVLSTRMNINTAGYINMFITAGAANDRVTINDGANNLDLVNYASGVQAYSGSMGMFLSGGKDLLLMVNAANIRFVTGGYTEVMRCTNAQYLLIGYTSSVGAYKLQVNGDMYVSGSAVYLNGVTYGSTQTFNGLVYLNSTTYVGVGQSITWKGSSGTTYDFSISNSGTVPYILSSAEIDLNAPIGMRYGLIYTFKGNGSSAYNVNIFNSGVAADELQFLGGLRLNTTTCGFIPPKMTTTQKNALSSSVKVAGCIVYDTTVNLLQAWNGSTWNNLW